MRSSSADSSAPADLRTHLRAELALAARGDYAAVAKLAAATGSCAPPATLAEAHEALAIHRRLERDLAARLQALARVSAALGVRPRSATLPVNLDLRF